MLYQNIKIEALGVYLPDKVVTTEELLQGCHHRPGIDLEGITGIHERRIAEGEYAADLAIKAAQRAMAMSDYKPEDVGLIVCTSISKYNRPHEVDFEPSTSAMVRAAIGAKKALHFDVINACAGMFNGLKIVESYIKSGAIKCGMVVSGEFNWPLMQTAQREIRHRIDGQLAALTLGDAGAAIILDQAADNSAGLHHLELITGAKHNSYCYSTPSPRGPGGMLITKAVRLQRKGAEHFPHYLKKAVEKTGWSMDDIDHGIAHQVSVRGVKRGVKEVNAFIGTKVPHRYLYNCDIYGNTTTTSHFIVLHGFMSDGTIKEGDRILFVSGASGIVITHGTYTMDKLAERYRAAQQEA